MLIKHFKESFTMKLQNCKSAAAEISHSKVLYCFTTLCKVAIRFCIIHGVAENRTATEDCGVGIDLADSGSYR